MANNTETQKYVGYYRVSTKYQQQSNLGLEAQKTAVRKFGNTGQLIGEFIDIESGKNNSRPELTKAIELAIRADAIIVISKLDRLSRNLSFVAKLMDSKVKFIALDLPFATDLTIHIFASLAEWERKKISERTKDALNQLKAKGVRLGSPVGFTNEIRVLGPEAIRRNAENNPNRVKAKRLIELLKNENRSLRSIADELNKAGFKTATGKEFHAEQVRRLL